MESRIDIQETTRTSLFSGQMMSESFFVIETEDGEEYYFKTVEARDKFLKTSFWIITYEFPYILSERKFSG